VNDVVARDSGDVLPSGLVGHSNPKSDVNP
jgi:hypothetical protein